MMAAMKYILHSIDLQSENPWENKAVYLLYSELVLGKFFSLCNIAAMFENILQPCLKMNTSLCLINKPGPRMTWGMWFKSHQGLLILS